MSRKTDVFQISTASFLIVFSNSINRPRPQILLKPADEEHIGAAGQCGIGG